MPTSNITITGSWTQLATDTNTDLLATFDENIAVEVASTATNTAPTVTGHRLSNQSAITRAVIGSGYVWARTAAGSVPSQISVIVSK